VYEWAQSSLHNLTFDSVAENEYKEEENLLLRQSATAETVHGTQQLHAFMTVKKDILNTKIYSASPNCTENCMISVLKNVTELVDFTGFDIYV
jgi:hypothetical protein